MLERVYVGIDVSKKQLDVAMHPTHEQWAVPNDDAGINRILARLNEIVPSRITVEAAGKLEGLLLAALAAAGHPVVLVNPRQVREDTAASGAGGRTYAPCSTWRPRARFDPIP